MPAQKEAFTTRPGKGIVTREKDLLFVPEVTHRLEAGDSRAERMLSLSMSGTEA